MPDWIKILAMAEDPDGNVVPVVSDDDGQLVVALEE